MDIRQKMNENPVVGGAVALGIVLVAIVIIIWYFHVPKDTTLPQTIADKGFFSDDDGKTWYVDDLKNVPPYQHNGKTAYRAQLYMNIDDDTKFVGYLQGYEKADKAKIEAAIAGGTPPSQALVEILPNVKKPGSAAWAKPRNGGPTLEYNKIITVMAADHPKDLGRGPLRVTDKDLAAGGS